MSIVGGLDIHRKQITFDYLDLGTGEIERGKIRPADREGLAGWLRERFADRVTAGTGVEFALEGCTGWRFVAEELAAAGIVAHLAEPAATAGLRGRKHRAKTDRADAEHLRQLLLDGRLPECWIAPARVLEWRARLETYQALRKDHTAWSQRIHAVLFHQGAPRLSREQPLRSAEGLAQLRAATAALSPAGQSQVEVALAVLDGVDHQADQLRRELTTIAAHVTGAKVLAARLYGVGPITALALTCWLAGKGRFSSARKAVRFVGLDVTVYSSDGKRSPGHLSRQGPAVLRWCLYEAGKLHARHTAPGYRYYTQVKTRIDGKRATLSQARRITREACHILSELGDDALTSC